MVVELSSDSESEDLQDRFEEQKFDQNETETDEQRYKRIFEQSMKLGKMAGLSTEDLAFAIHFSENQSEKLKQEYGDQMTASNRSEMIRSVFGRIRSNKSSVGLFRQSMGLKMSVSGESGERGGERRGGAAGQAAGAGRRAHRA